MLFSRLSLVFAFSNVLECILMLSSEFIPLENHWANWICIFMPFIVFGKFDHYLFRYSFCSFLLFQELTLWVCWLIWWCPTGLLVSVFSLLVIILHYSLCFLVLWFPNFTWLIFKLAGIFLHLFKYAVERI